jgi:hypothetical protein
MKIMNPEFRVFGKGLERAKNASLGYSRTPAKGRTAIFSNACIGANSNVDATVISRLRSRISPNYVPYISCGTVAPLRTTGGCYRYFGRVVVRCSVGLLVVQLAVLLSARYSGKLRI